MCVDVRKASSSVLIVGETEEAVAAARDDILARLRRTVKLDVTVEARQLQVRPDFSRPPTLRVLS